MMKIAKKSPSAQSKTILGVLSVFVAGVKKEEL